MSGSPTHGAALVPAQLLLKKHIPVTAKYDQSTNTLYLVDSTGAALRSFTGEITDSGVIVGRLPRGQVALTNRPSDRALTRALEQHGVVVRLNKTWATYGGHQYRAARVLVSENASPA